MVAVPEDCFGDMWDDKQKLCHLSLSQPRESALKLGKPVIDVAYTVLRVETSMLRKHQNQILVDR